MDLKCERINARLFTHPSLTSDIGFLAKASPLTWNDKDILQKPKPTTVKELQSFLGFANFFRNFIVNFAEKAYPLTKLLRKKEVWRWSEEQEKAYNQLIHDLTNPPVLAHYDPEAELEIRVDASDEGLGCVLVQIDDSGKRQLLGAYSRTYQQYEESYGITHKECLGILFGIRQARPFVFGRPFTVVTDHCGLCYLMKAKDLNSRLARWSLELAEYNFKIVYNSGKTHGDADFMSRRISRCNELHKGIIPEIFPNQILANVTDERLFPNQYCSDWRPTDTADAQRNDNKLRIIIQKLEQQFPITDKERKVLEKKYELRNNLLFRKLTVDNRTIYRLAIPDKLIRDVLYFCHDTPKSGHFGYLKTLWKVRQYAYWPDMNNDVYGYVRSCRECQYRKMPNHRPFGPQSKITPIADNVM